MTLPPRPARPSADPPSAPLPGRGAGVAAWRLVADHLAAGLASGATPPGGRLPSEGALAASLGVHRHTVRRALAELAARGLVRARRGSGTFAGGEAEASAGSSGGPFAGPFAEAFAEAPPLAYPLSARTRFSEIVAAQAREPEGRLIEAADEPAPADLAALLRVPPGAPLTRLTTLHAADGVPISTADAWFPAARLPAIARDYAATGSITRALALGGYGDYRRLATRVAARPATPEEAARLDLAPGRPVLTLDSVNADPAGAPLQATRARFAADRVRLVVGEG